MCLKFQFCTHQRVYILYFLKKSQIRCTLLCTHPQVPPNRNWPYPNHKSHFTVIYQRGVRLREKESNYIWYLYGEGKSRLGGWRQQLLTCKLRTRERRERTVFSRRLYQNFHHHPSANTGHTAACLSSFSMSFFSVVPVTRPSLRYGFLYLKRIKSQWTLQKPP